MIERILCIGAGYVGGPTMAVIAKHCPDVRIVVADINADRVRAWQSGEPPIYEPGLKEVVGESLGRNLHFTVDVAAAIADADLIFVSVNTPTKTFGQGSGRAADLQYWEKTARDILRHARGRTIVVEKSTPAIPTSASRCSRIPSSSPREPRSPTSRSPTASSSAARRPRADRPPSPTSSRSTLAGCRASAS
jgi:UDPglucose 6-dehydrogenase